MTATPRLSRLLAADGRCLDVAIDHGFFGEGAFLTGIEDMDAALDAVIDAQPDAIQLSPGMARVYGERPGPKPGLVLRTDVANVYHPSLPDQLFSESIADAVETAVRLDAAAVVVNLLRLPGQPEVLRQCIVNVNRLRPPASARGMPLMVEPLVMKTEDGRGGYAVDGDLELIVPLVRQAVELGADVIKADPCDDIADYHRVIETAAGVPVLVRGGGKVADRRAARAARRTSWRRAPRGIVYGRNIIQHPDPAGMTRALMAIVHEGTSPADALAYVSRGSDGVTEVRLGIIGAGLMGRELASATARWLHLLDLDFRPRITAVCDLDPARLEWFADDVVPRSSLHSDHRELLARDDVDAVYCAVPHNLHEELFLDVLRSGKHLFGEKPFGIDGAANARDRGRGRVAARPARALLERVPLLARPAGAAAHRRERPAGARSSRCAARSCTAATTTRASPSTGSAWRR